MKKKFVSIVLAAVMVVTMATGCGKSEPETPVITASPGSNSGTENQAGTGAAGGAENQSVTPAPETSTDDPEQVIILDYDELDAWISYGFKGTSPSGEEVLLGINGENDYGILIVTDDSDMTAFGYVGAYERSYDDSVDYGYITIADMAFGFKELADGELNIDMGDLGVTRVAVQTQPILMMRIEEIIEGYTFVY